MARWQDVVDANPDFAQAVEKAFNAYKHKVLATLRQDGSPRLSGIEATFNDGELWLGMMPGSRKALDLRNDPRMAVHSATADENMTGGDAKLSGRAIEVTDPAQWKSVLPDEPAPEGSHLFRIDITEVVLTSIGTPPDHIVIETWKPETGLTRTERR